MLRKATTALLLSLFLALPASAQVITPGLTGVGVKGGVAFPDLRGGFDGANLDDADSDFGFGYVAGIYGQVGLFRSVAPRIEALYVQKGAAVDGLGDTNSRINVDYIEVPLLIELNLPIASQVLPGLYAGPYGALAINREFDSEEFDDDLDGEDFFRPFDYGVAFGTGIDFTFAERSLTLDLRYDLGLADIVEDGDFNGGDNLRTSTFMATIGFSI